METPELGDTLVAHQQVNTCNRNPSNGRKYNLTLRKRTRRVRQRNSRSHPKPTELRFLHLQLRRRPKHLPPASDGELPRVYTLPWILARFHLKASRPRQRARTPATAERDKDGTVENGSRD